MGPIIPPSAWAARVHQVEVRWRVANATTVIVGPEPRLVLAVRARRDVEALLVRVYFPSLLHQAEGYGESVLAAVPHVTGLRRLKPEGEPWVWGQEDVAAAAMFSSDRPEELARAPEELRWWGGAVECIEHNVCHAPNDYWCLNQRFGLPKGLSLGVIVRADRFMPCRVRMSGV